jgi:membrane associated rhomboid family serine protease
MTPTPVGMRCPECSRERTKVRTLRSTQSRYSVTQILIAINVIAFLVESASGAHGTGGGGGWIWEHGVLLGPPLTSHNPFPGGYSGTHQYWRLLTAGFLHDGILHIAFNMLSLWFVGNALEPAIGRVNFTAIYFAALLAGSFGALLFEPDVPTVGASTAIFGIFGALIIVAWRRGIPLWQSGLAPILVINLVFTLSVNNISIGGHLGGLAAGLITGYGVVELSERQRKPAMALAVCALVGAASVVGAIAVAGSTGLTPTGFTI